MIPTCFFQLTSRRCLKFVLYSAWGCPRAELHSELPHLWLSISLLLLASISNHWLSIRPESHLVVRWLYCSSRSTSTCFNVMFVIEIFFLFLFFRITTRNQIRPGQECSDNIFRSVRDRSWWLRATEAGVAESHFIVWLLGLDDTSAHIQLWHPHLTGKSDITLD